MASPQKENGYTPIANEIMEALARIRINGEARQILDHILRQTYGWNKKEDAIALSQFHLATGIKKTSIQRGIKHLLVMNLIYEKEYGVAKKYCLVKDFDKWKPTTKKSTVHHKEYIVHHKEQKSTLNRVPQKQKAIIQKQKPLASKEAPLIVALIDSFEPVNPEFKKWYARPPQRNACQRLIEREGLEHVQRVVKMLPISNQTPYFPTITTPLELEVGWAKLKAAWDKKRNEQLTGKNGIA